MLPLLFAGMTAAAQNQDMARLGTYMDNGEFVVGTAETVLAADITVRCEKIVCGPYAAMPRSSSVCVRRLPIRPSIRSPMPPLR